MTSATQSAAKPDGLGIDAFANFASAQQRSASSLSQAGEIMSRTATAIWEKQTNFVQHETAEAMRHLGALSSRKDPGDAASAYLGSVRETVDAAIKDSREISDLLRESAWQLLALYAGFWSRPGSESNR